MTLLRLIRKAKGIVTLRQDMDIVPIFRLHLPDYNEAAWNIEGKYLYPEYKTYEEYCKAKPHADTLKGE